MFEAYSVAVRISLINTVTSGLMGMSREFAKVHGDAKALQAQLDKIKLTTIAGAAVAGTGLFGLGLLGKTLPYAKEYSRQMALMNTLGMKQADIAKVVGQAWKTSYAVPTTTAAQNLATFRELRSAFGSDPRAHMEAAAMLPVVARFQGVMQSLTGKSQDHVGFDMVKAIELRSGVMTEAALLKNAELMSRSIIAMGGTINVADYHGALKQSKLAGMKLNDDFTYNYLPTLMQELKTAAGGGAQSAGTIMMSLYQQMHGRMTKAAMPLWVQSGLVKPSDVVKNSTGSYQVKPGAVAGTALFEANPFQWVQQYLRPGVEKLMREQHISAETAINAMFSNRNAAFGAYNMYAKAAQYERDKVTISRADGGYAAYQKLLKTDPTLAQAALAAQWQNVLAQIGFSIMPGLIRGTLALMKGLQDLSAAMRAHPTLTKLLVYGFAGLSAALAFSGTVLLLRGAFMALSLVFTPIAGGVAMVTSSLSGLSGSIGFLSLTVAPATAALSGLAAVLVNVVAPLLALGAFGISVGKGMQYNGVLKDPSKASPQDLASAIAYAHRNVENYRSMIAKKQILPATGNAFLKRWEGEEARLRAAQGGGASSGSLAPSKYVAPASKQKMSFTGDVHMDGRKVGKVVWRHQANEMDRAANSSGGGFDGRMALTPAGLSRA